VLRVGWGGRGWCLITAIRVFSGGVVGGGGGGGARVVERRRKKLINIAEYR